MKTTRIDHARGPSQGPWRPGGPRPVRLPPLHAAADRLIDQSRDAGRLNAYQTPPAPSRPRPRPAEARRRGSTRSPSRRRHAGAPGPRPVVPQPSRDRLTDPAAPDDRLEAFEISRPPAMTAIRSPPRSTRVFNASTPSRAVGRPPEVSTRSAPMATKASRTSSGSPAWSIALWKVTLKGRAMATSDETWSCSSRPSASGRQHDARRPRAPGGLDIVPHHGQLAFRIDEVSGPGPDQDVDRDAQPSAGLGDCAGARSGPADGEVVAQLDPIGPPTSAAMADSTSPTQISIVIRRLNVLPPTAHPRSSGPAPASVCVPRRRRARIHSGSRPKQTSVMSSNCDRPEA